MVGQIIGYEIDVYRDIDEDEDVALTEFADEIDEWIIDVFKSIGCDTAKSVLELGVEELSRRTDLEEETINEVQNIFDQNLKTKLMRLSKAAKQLNITIQRIGEFLETHGHDIHVSPNTKLADNLYEMLLEEFSDLSQKQKQNAVSHENRLKVEKKTKNKRRKRNF